MVLVAQYLLVIGIFVFSFYADRVRSFRLKAIVVGLVIASAALAVVVRNWQEFADYLAPFTFGYLTAFTMAALLGNLVSKMWGEMKQIGS